MFFKMLAAIVLVILPSLNAAAADGSEQSLTWFAPLLLTATVLLAVIGWLGLRLRHLQRHCDALLARMQIAEAIIDRAPFPIVRVDTAMTVEAANQAAQQTSVDSPVVGRHVCALYPQLKNHPDILALQALTSESKTIPTAQSSGSGSVHTASHIAEGTLTGVQTSGRNLGVWYGLPANKASTPPPANDVDSLAEASANRMKSEFIANINHEVRTPMNAIIGYTEMLAHGQLGAKEKRFVDIIHKSSMALVSIFNDIMELSKIDSGRLQILTSTVRLSTIISEVEGLFRDLADEKGIQLICTTAEHLPQSYIIDGVRLKQVLQNLISNAVKFTQEGAVTLMADGAPSTTKPGCCDLRFSVEDTGIGIQEPDQKKIFDLFQQGEEVITKQYGGVGLGLTLCSRLVIMMGGRIDLHSVVGQGTRFTIHLQEIPVAEADSLSTEIEHQESVRQGNRKLLVVDDVDLIKDVFLDFFQDTPYTVLTAKNGKEALDLAKAEHPDLIFMDLNLRGSDGRSITRQLREDPETATIPVVVMTGEMLEEADYLPLFNGFLQKPFRLDALREIVNSYINVRPERAGISDESDEDDKNGASSFPQIVALWTDRLEDLRRQAVCSGSLADAATLGTTMLQEGKTQQQPVLSSLGEELLVYAQEPNILGVDRLLAHLNRITKNYTP